MELELAIKVLDQALDAANKAGVYTRKDSAIVDAAFETVKKLYLNTLDTNEEVVTVKNKK